MDYRVCVFQWYMHECISAAMALCSVILEAVGAIVTALVPVLGRPLYKQAGCALWSSQSEVEGTVDLLRDDRLGVVGISVL